MFQEHLQSFGILTEEDLALLEGRTYERFIPRNDFFIKEGEVAREVAFVKSGEFRSFYYASNGEEVTYCFRLAKTFVSAYSSLIQQTASLESIQALSDSELICISGDCLMELEEKSKNWLRLTKLMADQEYMHLEKRVFLLQKESAEKRYADLLKNQPELLQRVSLEQLSSYLGISQRHLSRIRGTVSN